MFAKSPVVLSLAVSTAVLLSGCTSMEITSDYDPTASFTCLQTYGWMPGQQGGVDDPRIDDAILDKRIRLAVETQLAADGYQRVTSEAPDFLVGYHAAVAEKMEVETMNYYYGYDAGWGPGYSGYPGVGYAMDNIGTETYIYHFDEGTSILDIANPETRQLIWRGSAQAEVNLSDRQDRRDQRLKEAVRQILERFPPDIAKP